MKFPKSLNTQHDVNAAKNALKIVFVLIIVLKRLIFNVLKFSILIIFKQFSAIILFFFNF